MSELDTMLPLFCRVATNLARRYPSLHFVWPIPSHLMNKQIRSKIAQTTAPHRITIIHNPDTLYYELASCCCAITKPGTSTMELALLHIPMVVAFKVSWLTYTIASWLVQMPWIGLPNIMLNNECFTELLQDKCTHELIFNHACQLIDGWRTNSSAYQQKRAHCTQLHTLFARNQ